ncbi:6-aminohexanoate hydrolase [Rhodobaculum claviforme]|uniref:6-aminohexanoate hydrolase n=2 Tax=Rhodobaculum claviforme TaxID=1549854 RepID=A0A934TK98_9RHOB|nr:serine hydrolase [Rhodobaculum claviforme]MBK5927325.1 6-aminohexanoate hydrolase [Rhodobaculum claviforme]
MPTRRALLVALSTSLVVPALHRARAATPDDVARAARGLDQLHAIVVQRGDAPVVAEAPRGPGLSRPANIKSASKSVLGLLLGLAVARGAVPGPHARLADVAPRLIPAAATEGVEDLTLHDLVTLRAGLEGTSGARYGAWVSTRNWVAHALTRPWVAQPGGRMIYSTGSSHVLGAALVEATGDSLLAQARAGLGRPLGIEIPDWPRDPQGYHFGGNDMVLSPRAMLRVALVMRDAGRVEGVQVVPEAWVRASARPVTRSAFSGLGYGLGWFVSPSGWVLGRGYGGQVIAAHGRAGLAVAITSDPTRPARSDGHFGDLMRLLDGPVLDLA